MCGSKAPYKRDKSQASPQKPLTQRLSANPCLNELDHLPRHRHHHSPSPTSLLSSHQIRFPRLDLKAYNRMLRSHTLWATLKLKPWVRDFGITSLELMNLKKSGFHSLLLSQHFMLLITYPLFSITRNYIARKKITYFTHLLKTNLSRKAKMLSFFFKDFTIVQGQMTKNVYTFMKDLNPHTRPS